jgi:hypothetical protein
MVFRAHRPVGLVRGGEATSAASPMPLGSSIELLPPTLRFEELGCVLLITRRAVDARLYAPLPRAIPTSGLP